MADGTEHDGLASFRDHAATLGRECAMRRVAYYQRIVEAREVEVERYRAVARIYDDRAQVAEPGDCDE